MIQIMKKKFWIGISLKKTGLKSADEWNSSKIGQKWVKSPESGSKIVKNYQKLRKQYITKKN